MGFSCKARTYQYIGDGTSAEMLGKIATKLPNRRERQESTERFTSLGGDSTYHTCRAAYSQCSNCALWPEVRGFSRLRYWKAWFCRSRRGSADKSVFRPI